MSMERWNPFRDMDVMRQAMDRWFDDRLGNYFTGSNSGQVASVAVDLHETENGYELTASLPGVRPEDVDITINRDTIVLRGRSEQSTQRQQGNYIYRERHSGTFQRTVRLPEPINADQTEATLENGVLRLSLPRLQQTTNRRVQVRTGGGAQSLNTNNLQNTGTSQMGNNQGSGNTQNTGSNQGTINSQSTVGRHFGDDQAAGGSAGNTQSTGSSTNVHSVGSQNTGTTQTGTGVASQSGVENIPVRTEMRSGIDSPGAATTTMGGNISRDVGSPEVSSMSGSNNQGGTMSGSQSNQGQGSTQRPSVLADLGSTELGSLETHIASNDQDGFMRLASSYGWDQQTCQEVWNFMSHNPSSSEANTAFGSGSSQQSSSAQL